MWKGLVSTCLCYFDQAHVTWGSCGSKQPYLKCCGFFFLEITSKEQSSSFKIKQFTKGTEFFKERLGLVFKKVDGKLCCSHPRFIVRGFFIVYSGLKKGCRKKCTRQSQKVLWVVLSALFSKEIWKNGMRGPESMFASANRKQQK